MHQLTVAGNEERPGEGLRNVGDTRVVLPDVGLKRHRQAGELLLNACGIDCINRACCAPDRIGAFSNAAAQYDCKASADQTDDKLLVHATLLIRVG